MLTNACSLLPSLSLSLSLALALSLTHAYSFSRTHLMPYFPQGICDCVTDGLSAGSPLTGTRSYLFEAQGPLKKESIAC